MSRLKTWRSLRGISRPVEGGGDTRWAAARLPITQIKNTVRIGSLYHQNEIMSYADALALLDAVQHPVQLDGFDPSAFSLPDLPAGTRFDELTAALDGLYALFDDLDRF